MLELLKLDNSLNFQVQWTLRILLVNKNEEPIKFRTGVASRFRCQASLRLAYNQALKRLIVIELKWKAKESTWEILRT